METTLDTQMVTGFIKFSNGRVFLVLLSTFSRGCTIFYIFWIRRGPFFNLYFYCIFEVFLTWKAFWTPVFVYPKQILFSFFRSTKTPVFCFRLSHLDFLYPWRKTEKLFYVFLACAICGVLCISLPIPIIVNNFNKFYEKAKIEEEIEVKRKKTSWEDAKRGSWNENNIFGFFFRFLLL